MMDFQCSTRGTSTPHGKPRIYFTAHPDDYNKYQNSIFKDILDRHNCAIFFLDGCTSPQDVENYELKLSEMQLFVLPITQRLLTDHNRAIEVDVPFAFRNHIPVLPLMQEGVSDDLFKSRFGDLQYLDKHVIDPTAIPYDKKLTQYLNSIIVGDELAKQIRASFDAYVFLSYRKKDREYAHKLMRLIHSNPFFRDIAIWYDEFLTPGEDFNEAIYEALNKSDLFALTVTPNLLEMPCGKPNFIMDKEYPVAKESGKLLFPVEMLPTDSETLKKYYEEIPTPIKADNDNEFEKSLREIIQALAISINDSDMQHNFFIGLAYLSGIDVEVNHERAFKLIADTAKKGYIPAIEKLVTMFSTGEGVNRDTRKAIEWQVKLVRKLEDKAEDTYSEDDAVELMNANMDLGGMARNSEDYKLAEEAYAASYKLASCLAFGAFGNNLFCKVKNLFKKYVTRTTRYEEAVKIMAQASRMMMELSYEIGVQEMIREWTMKTEVIIRAIDKQFADAETAVDLISISNLLARECLASGNISGTQFWLETSEKCLCDLTDEEKTFQVKLAFSESFNAAAVYHDSIGCFSEAYHSQEDRKELLLALNKKFPDNYQIWYLLIDCILDEAEICIHGNDYKCANDLLSRAKKVYDAEVSNKDENTAKTLLSDYYYLSGKLNFDRGDYSCTIEPATCSHEILLSLEEYMLNSQRSRRFAEVCELLGDTHYALRQFDKAAQWHIKAIDVMSGLVSFSKLVRDSRMLANLYEKALEDSLERNSVTDAREFNEKALWVRRGLVEGTQLKTGFSKKDISVLIKEGKIDGTAYDRDVEAYSKLRKRQEEISESISSFPKLGKTLMDYIEGTHPKCYTAINRYAKLITDFSENHVGFGNMIDLLDLKASIEKAEELADIITHEEISVTKTLRQTSNIVNYISNHMRPFLRYDEDAMLLMAFCSYLNTLLSLKSVDEKKRRLSIIFEDIVFFDYPISKIYRAELWCDLYYRIIIDLDSDEET